MLLKEVIGKSVITLKEGKKVATAKKLLVNRKNKTLEYILLNINSESSPASSHIISFEDIEGIGDYALLVRNLDVVKELSEVDTNSIFYENLTDVINEIVIDARGDRIGKVATIYIEEQYGKIQELGIVDERNNNELLRIDSNNILTFGYDVIIVKDENQNKSNLLKKEVTSIEEISIDEPQINPSDENDLLVTTGFSKEVEDDKLLMEEEFDSDLELFDDSEIVEWKEKMPLKEKNRLEIEEVNEYFFKADSKVDEAEEEGNIDVQELNLTKNLEEDLLNNDLFNEENGEDNEFLGGLGSLESHGDDLQMINEEMLPSDENLSLIENFQSESLPISEKLFEEFGSKKFESVTPEKKGVRETQKRSDNPRNEYKYDLDDFDEEKSLLIRQFIDRQREMLVGKRLTADIFDRSGNILMERGHVITIDLFNRISSDHKDSIVEMAMFSE